MRLNHREIEGCDLIEKLLSGSKPGPMLKLILQALLDGSGCLRHAHQPFFASIDRWMVSLLFSSFSTGKKRNDKGSQATRHLTACVLHHSGLRRAKALPCQEPMS